MVIPTPFYLRTFPPPIRLVMIRLMTSPWEHTCSKGPGADWGRARSTRVLVGRSGGWVARSRRSHSNGTWPGRTRG